MKKLILITILASLGMYITGIIVGIKLGQATEQDKISWPKEVIALSCDSTRPDTLIGYKKRGKVYINFNR